MDVELDGDDLHGIDLGADDLDMMSECLRCLEGFLILVLLLSVSFLGGF